VCPLRSCSVNESPVVCHRGQRDDKGTSCDKREREANRVLGRLELPRSARTEGQLATSIPSPHAAPLSSWILVVRIQRTRNLQILVYLCSVKLLQSRDKALYNAAQRQQVAQSPARECPPIFGISIQIRIRPGWFKARRVTRCPWSSVDTR
jgi:hypothetical protein